MSQSRSSSPIIVVKRRELFEVNISSETRKSFPSRESDQKTFNNLKQLQLFLSNYFTTKRHVLILDSNLEIFTLNNFKQILIATNYATLKLKDTKKKGSLPSTSLFPAFVSLLFSVQLFPLQSP